MSKLSFRARALDASKPMPIYMAEELPDLPDYSAINRAVPQMPSGMEKEEECEHHLQRAICTGLIIPTPEVSEIPDAEVHDKLYPANYKQPRQLIHMQPFTMEQDIPDYDMDSEDERWLESQAKKLELTPLKFEEMMDQLEKSSGQTVITLHEAKALLKEDDDLIIAVFDYWLNKRLNTQHPLILSVKTDKRVGTATNNPYLAFRRRTEKMQTRKNRKNDETSYEKMLKLKRDLTRAVTLLELVKRREKIKRECVHLSVEIFEKRYQAKDFNGAIISELSALKTTRPAFTPIFHNHYTNQSWTNKAVHKDEVIPRKEKRQYKKRKHKSLSHNHVGGYGTGSIEGMGVLSSDEEPIAQPSPEPEESEEEGQFVFRRNKLCTYHMPLTENGNWPWCSKEDNGLGDKKYRYTLTSISKPKRCIGFARRRIGRGGRVILDRFSNEDDDFWRTLDYTIYEKNDVPVTNAADKSTVSDSTNSFTNLLGNGLNHRNSNNNNINNVRTDLKTEHSQSNCSLRKNDVFSESVSENLLCTTKQEPADNQEKDQHKTAEEQEEMTEFLRSVQNWLHFRPKTPPSGYEPPCHLLPPEDTTFLPSANTPFSIEMKVLDAPNTFLDTSTFVTTPFLFEDLDTVDVPVTDTRQSSDTKTQTGINLNVNVGFNTLNTNDSLSNINNLNDSSVFSNNNDDEVYLMDTSEESTIGCSRFKVTDIASCTGSASKNHNKSCTLTNTKLNSVNVTSDVRLRTNSDGPISNGIITQYGINASPVNAKSSGNKLKSYAYFEVMGNSSDNATSTLSLHTSAHTVTLNSHSANLLEIPLPNDTDSVPKKVNSQCTENSTTSPNNKNKTIVRKNNLAMEVT